MSTAVLERVECVDVINNVNQYKFNLKRSVRRGDVFLANLGAGKGSVQGGIRPVVVLSNNVGNKYSTTVIVAAISSRIHKAKLPTHVVLPKELGFDRDSFVMLEQVMTIDKKQLGDYITHLNQRFMKKIEDAALVSIGISM